MTGCPVAGAPNWIWGGPCTTIVQKNISNRGVYIQNAPDDHVSINAAASIAAGGSR